MTVPLVAIVGRPNVGKSTLFNRLMERRDAIVSDVPGTTRDRLLGDASWDGRRFTIVDTGGLEPSPQDPLIEKVKAQVEAAVSEADLIIFLLDVAHGLTPMDTEIANWLRRTQKPLVVAINKVDNEKREIAASEFYQLGLEDLLFISAYHNLGIYDLMDKVVSLLPAPDDEEDEAAEGVVRLAIIDRTNVGKSMLMNAILGQDRAIVSDIPGTTRDALDTHFTYDDQPAVLVDTAGIRRPGKVERGIEYYSVLRTVRAVQRCDIALLVMDGSELATAQDAHISGNAWDEYRGMIVVVNKWDLVPKEDGSEQELAIQAVRERLHFMPYAPICFTSALLGEGIDELMALATSIYQERLKHIPPGRLRYALLDALADQMPPSRKGRRLRIKEVSQVDVNPPTFVFAVNDPRLVHFSYERYLENRLRSTFGFTHTHLRLVFRERI
ncbi:MAG: ribosome biogenesis GTPase Der [Dehalococcoidia bacterium]|nr:ribosome biogenesis GTPase Der [Dehalococcoidia bacterium]